MKIVDDRDDVFIFRLNGKGLYFEKAEFSIITGLKCGKKSYFFYPNVPNKLMQWYDPRQEKVKRLDFYLDFIGKKSVFMDGDFFKMG